MTHIICFGDIHGHRGAAEAAISLAEDLGVPAVFLGDYVDRGPDSAGVLRVLMSACYRHPDWVFLLGNHDLMLKDILEGNRRDEGYDERTFFETLPTLPLEERAAILKWLQARPAFMRSGAFLFVHGGFIDPAISLEHVSTEELVWTYGIPADWLGETVIRGHAIVERVQVKIRDVNINTGCGFGGYLTGLLLSTAHGSCVREWHISEEGKIIQTAEFIVP